jgi:hypothetical protein
MAPFLIVLGLLLLGVGIVVWAHAASRVRTRNAARVNAATPAGTIRSRRRTRPPTRPSRPCSPHVSVPRKSGAMTLFGLLMSLVL